VWPFWRPNPLTSVTVIPTTPTSWSAGPGLYECNPNFQPVFDLPGRRFRGEPVLLVYIRSNDTVTVFSRGVSGQILTFKPGRRAGRLADVETRSQWDSYGTCLEGTLRGSQLKELTGRPQFWWGWAAFGETDVYSVPGRGARPGTVHR